MENVPSAFQELVSHAENLLQTDASAQEVLVVRTAKDNVFHCFNHDIMSGDYSEEEAFAQMLIEREDTQIPHIVCMWAGRMCLKHIPSVDVPSWHMRQLLTKIDPRNGETEVIVNGFGGFLVKKFKILVPPKS